MAAKRIAVVGTGIIGRAHIATIARTGGFELAALVDPDPAAAARASSPEVPAHPDIDAMLGAGGVDGVIIASPNHTHVEAAVRCLDAGVPVLVEKPVAESAAAAEGLIAAEQRTGVPVLVGHHRRHNPIARAAKAAIAAGRIGHLVAATVTGSLFKDAPYFEVAWRRTPGAGGPMLINLIHEIDLLRFFFGEIEAVRAMTSYEQRGLEVEDGAAVIARFAAGGLATLNISDAAAGPWSWDITSGESPGRFPAHDVPAHLYAGSEAGLSLPDLTLWSHDGAKSWYRPLYAQLLPVERADPYVLQLRHFGDVIAGRAEPLVGTRDAASSLACVKAAQRSAASGLEERPVSP